MHEPRGLAVGLRKETEDLVLVPGVAGEDAAERRPVHLLGHAGLVEFQISGPQPAPLVLVGRLDGADRHVSHVRIPPFDHRRCTR